MDILIIVVIVLVMLCGIFGVIASMALPDLMLKLKTKKMIKKGFAMFCFVDGSFNMKKKWLKVNSEVEYDGGLYYCNPKYCIKIDGKIPSYFYFKGDSRPIDMLKKKRDSTINPEIMSLAMIKAKMAGSISKPQDNKMMFWVAIATLAMAGLAGALMFTAYSNWNDVIMNIPSICGAVKV